MKKYNIGVVGTGHIANIFHIPSFLKNKKIKKIHLFDVNKKKLNKCSKKFKIFSTFNNFQKMINTENIDILNICTPPSLHYKYIIKGIENNLNLIVEKPFVISSKELNHIKKKIRNSKIHCYCAYHQRARPISKKIKEIIQDKKIGKIYYINLVYRRFRGVPKHSKFFSNKKYSGGGPLIDIGSHFFDLIGWFLKFPKVKNYHNYSLKRLFSSRNNNNKTPFIKFDNEEVAVGNFELKDGCLVNYELGYALNVKDEVSCIEIFGTKGMIKWPKGEITLLKKNRKFTKKISIKSKKASEIQSSQFIELFSKKFNKRHLNEISFTVDLIEKLYKSSK